MGLDSYFNATKALNPKHKADKQIIEILESNDVESKQNEDGLFISQYFENTADIYTAVNEVKMRGKRGHINVVKKVDGIWYITTEAMYWRKANQIHNWFVNNCQYGIDDCGYYDVSVEQCNELLTIVDTVLADKTKAIDLLPSCSGFFFGSTDYDEWYFHDLKRTRKFLKGMLKQKTFTKCWKLSYHASW